MELKEVLEEDMAMFTIRKQTLSFPLSFFSISLLSLLLQFFFSVEVAAVVGIVVVFVYEGRKTKEEIFTIHRNFGVQIEKKNALGFVSSSTFYPMDSVQDILVVEGIATVQVLFYFAIKLSPEQQQEMVLPFCETRPRLEIIRKVYQHAMPYMTNRSKEDLAYPSIIK